jgi:hypothetical protein
MRTAVSSSDIGNGSGVINRVSEEIGTLGDGEGKDDGGAVVGLDESVSRLATPVLYCRTLP